ncbi:MAG: hypothetical protein ABEJ67_05165 [Halanaeroarchaeum sp.]
MTVLVTLGLGVFLVLHGFVHLWYVVLSQGWVEVEDQMGWNGRSWLCSSVVPAETTLAVASLLYVAVALGFAGGAVGLVVGFEWAEAVVTAAAVLSTLVLVAMWDGEPDRLVEKGIIGVVINAAIVGVLLIG